MAIGPFDQLDKGNAAVARQQHTVVRLYTPGDQAEQKSIIAVLRPGALIHEQIAQQLDALLYLQDVAHGNAHVYMPRRINQAADSFVVLSAVLPEIHKHICLAVIQKSVRRNNQIRSTGNDGIVLNHPRQVPGGLANPVIFVQANVASRRGNQNVEHIQDNVTVHRRFIAQRYKEIDFIFFVRNTLIDIQNAFIPVFPFLQHACRDIAGADVFIDRENLQLGRGL